MPNNPTVVSSVPMQNTLPVVGNLTAASNSPILGNTIAPKDPTVALPNSIPVPIGHPVPSNPPTQRDRDVLTRLPKSLQYDGRSNWSVFRTKFERYVTMNNWTEAESADCLVWCLTGKAVDFYAVLAEGGGTVPYSDLMQRLQERFGAKELPATAQGRFQVAHQELGESLDDWSDRVLTLAAKAFRDLPSTYATQQAVARFCQGLSDKEASKHVSLQVPTSIGDAMNRIKMHSHILAACASVPLGGPKGKSEDPRRVHAVNMESSQGALSWSAVDRLVQVMERLEGTVGNLSQSGGNSAGNVHTHGYGNQRQGRYPEGAVGGYRNQNTYGRGPGSNANNPYNQGYNNRNGNPAGAPRGGYANRGGLSNRPSANQGGRPDNAPPPDPGRRGSKQDMVCFKCGRLGHFQRECPAPAQPPRAL
ncbi:hypothetical protein DPMN_060588 [Dreissena polymorpha]|uniref:CCHC-type domain-containing protein n=1 Tax=Dreissena polymorpha TaxID=45954 RepID=A0A9D4C5H8_DREPO|nr:hypothetical protein DPMN_060588 [Dreissena polymorpha]